MASRVLSAGGPTSSSTAYIGIAAHLIKMLGNAFVPPKPHHADPAARILGRIEYMVAALVIVHVGIFILIVTASVTVAKTVNYYQTYLSGPLSGPNVADAVSNAMVTVVAVRNISSLASSLAAAAAGSVGFQQPNTTRRMLLSVQEGSGDNGTVVQEGSGDNGTVVQEAVANLLNSLSDKVQQFDAVAPGHFLEWLTSTNPGPYIRQLLMQARYAEASLGTFLGALGSPVDPSITGPDLVGLK